MFYETIIKHHEQAITMVDEFLPKLTRPELKAMAARMKADQAREIPLFSERLLPDVSASRRSRQ